MFRCAPQDDNSDQRSRSILPAALVVLGKAYPANDVPGVEVGRELALVFVARDQHDDAPIVDVLEVDGESTGSFGAAAAGARPKRNIYYNHGNGRKGRGQAARTWREDRRDDLPWRLSGLQGRYRR
jgi:hypothetical protein